MTPRKRLFSRPCKTHPPAHASRPKPVFLIPTAVASAEASMTSPNLSAPMTDMANSSLDYTVCSLVEPRV
jgi:hypothetical protein